MTDFYRHAEGNPDRGDEGFALIITVLVMMTIGLLGLGGLFLSNNEIKIAGNKADAGQAFLAAEGGLEHAKARASYFITAGPNSAAAFPAEGVSLPFNVSGALSYDRTGNPPPGRGTSMKFFQSNYYTALAVGVGRHGSRSEVEENLSLTLPKAFVDN